MYQINIPNLNMQALTVVESSQYIPLVLYAHIPKCPKQNSVLPICYFHQNNFTGSGITLLSNTVKYVCSDHLNNNINYLWFIQQCVLMETEGINLLLLTISAFCSSFRWPLAT